jgi:hypothetical protein
VRTLHPVHHLPFLSRVGCIGFVRTSNPCIDDRALEAGKSVTGALASNAFLPEIREQPSKNAKKQQANQRTIIRFIDTEICYWDKISYLHFLAHLCTVHTTIWSWLLSKLRKNLTTYLTENKFSVHLKNELSTGNISGMHCQNLKWHMKTFSMYNSF